MPPYLPPNDLSQSWQDSEISSGKVLPLIPLNSQGETKSKINGKPCQILVDTGASFSILNPALIEQKKSCEKEVSVVRVSNEIQSFYINLQSDDSGTFDCKSFFWFLFVLFLFVFWLCDTAPLNLLGRDLLSKPKGLILFASNGDLILEFPDQPELIF